MSLSAEKLQNLQLLMEEYVSSFEKTINTITNADTTFSVSKVDQLEEEELISILSGDVVRANVPIAQGLEGSFTFVWPTDLVAKMADLMLAGDGTAQFNSEEHIDAIQEIASQILGPIATHLSDNLEDKVEFSTPEAGLAESSQVATDLSSLVTTVITGTLGEEKYQWTFSISTDQAIKLAEISIEEETSEPDVMPENVEFESFPNTKSSAKESAENMDMLMDLSLQVSIELGRTRLYIKNILELGQGSVIELNKLSGDPVDIYVNDKKFAEGEVVVVDENFGVRITDLVSPSERVEKLSD
ncbi:MAG: flagellar motor switch protein FliN [Candidatus Marinimicrobia bacterium]|nr:flagellar motor switch protein FliN [Candidatus Neomarinimicrobiota bacterium]